MRKKSWEDADEDANTEELKQADVVSVQGDADKCEVQGVHATPNWDTWYARNEEREVLHTKNLGDVEHERES